MSFVFIDPQTYSEYTLVLPKNSGLENYRKQLEELPNTKITVRAEDVPLFVEKMLARGVKCVGLTGQDLLSEYRLKNPFSKVKQLKRIPWEDTLAMFGKPSLCLLGPANKRLNLLDKSCTFRVAVNSKYRATADKFLNELSQKGFSFEKIFLNGATEEAAKQGFADLVVDIVSSGKSAREAGLSVYERIIESDAALVGGFDEN